MFGASPDGMNGFDSLFFYLTFIFIGRESAFDLETSGDAILSGEAVIAIGGVNLVCAELIVFTLQYKTSFQSIISPAHSA